MEKAGIKPVSKRWRRWGHYYYWIEKPKPPVPTMWRYTVAINFPLHRKYWGAIGQIWRAVSHADTASEDLIADILANALADWLGYSERELWFDISAIVGEAWQEVPYSRRLLDSWEVRIEDEQGRTRHREAGNA